MPQPNKIAVWLVLLCFVFQPIAHLSAQELALPAADITAPKIEHATISEEMPAGQPLSITVGVTDETGVKAVTLFYRVKGTENYQRLPMSQQGGTNNYLAVIPSDDSRVPGIEYYVQAEDLAGNTLLRGYDFMPLQIAVYETTPVVPIEEEKPMVKKGLSTTQWVLIGLGVAAAAGIVAAVAGGGGGGSSGGGGGTPASTGSITVGAPAPE